MERQERQERLWKGTISSGLSRETMTNGAAAFAAIVCSSSEVLT